MKIWTWGSSPRSGSRNAWTRIKSVNGASRLSNFGTFRRDPSDFLSRLVTMDETWLHHYKPETKQKSMQWRHSGWPRPKKSRVQKFAGKFLALIFWDQDGILLIDYLPKGQTVKRSITYLCWWNWRTFWRKNATGSSPKRSCSYTKMPRPTGHLHPRRNWPTWASSVLIWPRRSTTCSLDWKQQLKVGHFSSDKESLVRGDLVGRKKFWFFFSDLLKSQQRAKKYIELRGKYVE